MKSEVETLSRSRSEGDKVTKGNQTVEANLYVNGNASVDGKVEIGGNVNVARNMKVEGFLDAPNIRGCSKGLFLTRESLIAAYPRPHKGWWALVRTDYDNGELYVTGVNEYEQLYWEDTGETVPLGNCLLTQFEQYDTEISNLDTKYADAVSDINAILTTIAGEISTLTSDSKNYAEAIELINETLTNLQSGVSSLSTTVGSMKDDVDSAKVAAEEAKETATSVQTDVTNINSTLATYPENMEKLGKLWTAIEGGRINNGSERFNGTMCSQQTTCVFYDDAGEEYDGIVWLCDKKMFVAYKAAAVTGNGCTEAVWFFFYHWATDYLYMDNVATEAGLWKDKVYIHGGAVYVWANCDNNLIKVSGSGDIEELTEEELDEAMADFVFVDAGDIITDLDTDATSPLNLSIVRDGHKATIKGDVDLEAMTDGMVKTLWDNSEE